MASTVMTLDEAIRNARAEACVDDLCADEHDQLAEWLEELRELRTKHMHTTTRDEILEVLQDAEALLADGFDSAMIGYLERAPGTTVALYDRTKCISILMERDGMSEEEAHEHFEFNVLEAWVGNATPAFATLCS